MAAMFLAKRVMSMNNNISRTSPKSFPNYLQSAWRSRISRDPSFSSAYERAEASNAAEESKNIRDPNTPDANYSRGGVSDANYEKDAGLTGFVAGAIKDGAKKTLDMAENDGEAAKQTVDNMYKITKEINQNMKENVEETTENMKENVKETTGNMKENVARGGGGNDNNYNYEDDNDTNNNNVNEDFSVDEVKKVDGPVDIQEYRSIEDVRAEGGYDRKL